MLYTDSLPPPLAGIGKKPALAGRYFGISFRYYCACHFLPILWFRFGGNTFWRFRGNSFFENLAGIPFVPQKPSAFVRQNSQKSAKSTPVRHTFSHSSIRLCRKPQSKRVNESKGGRKKYARNHAKRNSWRTLSELGRGINQRTHETLFSQLQN